MIIEVMRAVHADRFPQGRHFGADAEQILVYGATVMLYLEGKPLRVSKIAHYLDLPNETTRRHIDKLIQYGLIEYEDHTLILRPHIAKTPTHHRAMLGRLVKGVMRYV